MQRTKEHIDKTLAALRAAWLSNPHLRLGQLIYNALPPSVGGDPFYVEDETLVKGLNDKNPHQ